MHRVTEEILLANEWRDGEFAKLRTNQSSVDERLWCRMCIPMIYAHWEGYVVSSLRILIEHINRLEISHSSVKTRMIVVGLGDSFKTLSGKQSFDQRAEFVERFRILLSSSLRIANKIDTKSNLKSSVLAEICGMYGFDFNRFSEVIGDIDRLVHVRNSIAHGENSFVLTQENVETYVASVVAAMDVFREEIDDFLIRETYLIGHVDSDVNRQL